mgnify:FL=1
MALPKLDTPKYQLTLPSTGETIEYRPFLVKEQKVLMMAQESKDEKSMLLAVGDLVNGCTFGKVDAKRAPTFDIEYVFLKIRSKSVGETVNLNVICPDDGKTQVPVTVNLDEIELLSGAEHRTDIALTDEITMNFRYPIMSDLYGVDAEDSTKTSFKLLNKCVSSIQSGDTVFNRVDMTDKDVDDFIDQMNNRQFEDVMSFFNSMPKLRHIVNVINPNTKVQNEVVLEGLQNFLG